MYYKVWYSPYTDEIRLTLGGQAIQLCDWMSDRYFTYNTNRKFSKTWVYLGEYE